MRLSVTRAEAEAALSILSERLAGGSEDWAGATGKTIEEAEAELAAAERLSTKLSHGLGERPWEKDETYP